MEWYILQLISRYTDISTLASIEAVAKIYNNDYIWKDYALYRYGKEFWNKASKRPVITSKPCDTWKNEIKRMYLFEREIYKLNEYCISDLLILYYELWLFIDR